MAPLVPRMHLWEIDDQPWFPSWLRGRVQAVLTLAWTLAAPPLQTDPPSHVVAALLTRNLADIASWIMIDFCAGGGGPTPTIERVVNASLVTGHDGHDGHDHDHDPVRFVLTDLHPHADNWAAAAAASPNVLYEPDPVDASAAAKDMIDKYAGGGTTTTATRKKVFRLYNLAFHHFDDPLARAILKNTVETSDGFGIFELQDRSLAACATLCLFGLGILLCAPYYAWKWRSPATLFFSYLVPIIPFVLVFDGFVSALRTRTPEEVEVLLRTCGAEGADNWVLRSGRERHMWPCGYVSWVICTKKDN